jgi:protein disulfide-isomerase
MTTLFENGEISDSLRGVKSIDLVSGMIETALEKEKPGSRPEKIELPAPGDKELPGKRGSDDSSESSSGNKEASNDSPSKTSSNTDKSTVEGSKNAPSKDEKPLGASTEKTDGGSKKPADESDSSKATKDTKAEESSQGKKWKSPTSAELFNNRTPKPPSAPPNPNGLSVPLTAESFQKLVTMSQDPWFIKFYAPWCPHCQALGPTWDQLAKTLEGKLNIGEVNCDKETRLCKDVKAKAYPTILFFKGGERAEYRGLRGLGDFVQYAEKAVDLASGVPDVDAAAFEAMEEKEEVIFVYFYDHATTTEDFLALERLPLSLIGHAKLVKTNDPKLYDRFKISTFPRLLVSREGRPTYFTPLTPNEIRDVHGVLDWMKSVWLPLVPELTAANARQIMDGKIVVLGVLNHEDQVGFDSALREMKSAANEWMDRQIQEFQLERKKLRDAKQMRIEEAEDRDDQRALRAAKAIRIDMNNAGRKEVGFAWVDGTFWQRWIRTTYGIDAADGERVIINDQDVSFVQSNLHCLFLGAVLTIHIYRAEDTGTPPLQATTSWSAGLPSPSPSTRSSTVPTPSSPSSPSRSLRSSSSTFTTASPTTPL